MKALLAPILLVLSLNLAAHTLPAGEARVSEATVTAAAGMRGAVVS